MEGVKGAQGVEMSGGMRDPRPTSAAASMMYWGTCGLGKVWKWVKGVEVVEVPTVVISLSHFLPLTRLGGLPASGVSANNDCIALLQSRQQRLPECKNEKRAGRER